MHDDQANQLQEVLLYGLQLRDRVAGGGRPHLVTEQDKLQGLLGPASLPPPWATGAAPPRGRGFLGIRYALACWLDEILIEAGWQEWDDNHLEFALYQTNIRYQNFWDQALLTETGSAAEAQEAFLLCVLLGFRGAKRDQPDRLREWVQGTRSRVTHWLGQALPDLPQRAVATDVPPLLGIEAYRAMTQRMVVGLLAAVLVVAFLVMILLS